MALTQQQWYDKLKTFVPAWMFSTGDDVNDAMWGGLAEVFRCVELELENHIKETYICQAEGGYLDEHGAERNLVRGTAGGGELDAAFAQRIKNLVNSTNCPFLQAGIDNILKVGTSKVIDNYQIQSFYDREHFYSRGDIVTEFLYNFFTVFINPQVQAGLNDSYSRDCFYDRDCFYSSAPPIICDDIYESIVNFVEKNKALGTLYQVIVTESSF